MIQRIVRTLCGALAATCLLGAAATAQSVNINELYVSHSGTDFYEYIELKGTPGMALTDYVVCVVEGDYGTTGTGPGTLDRGYNLTGYTIPASGYFVLGSPNLPSGAAPFTADYVFPFGSDNIENGTDTFYLVLASSAANATTLSTTTGSGGQIGADIDALAAPDDDLITTIPGLGTIVESLALVDCGYYYIYNTGTCSPNAGLDRIYDGAPVMPTDGTCLDPASTTPPLTSCQTGGFLPGGVFRGLDYPAPWCPELLDFNEPVNTTEPRTPGAQNSACPSTPAIVNYCTAGTTTNGCTSTMSSAGTPSVSATSGFVVTANTVEGAKQGIVFYGTLGPVATPWGTSSSYLCVKSPTQRTGTQSSGGTAGACDGSLSLDLLAYLAANPAALGNPFSAGQKCWLQGWFRDPPSPKTTMLSDGLEVTFAP